jgi:hypothetical protein
MIEQLKNSSIMLQGGFVAVVGLVGVFLVLVLFLGLIKLLQKFEKKQPPDTDQS